MSSSNETVVYVQLVDTGRKVGALANVAGVQVHTAVSACVHRILTSLVSFREKSVEQVELFLSSEAGVEESPPSRIGGPLRPNKSLRGEVLARLNAGGGGAGVPLPAELYLLAVAKGA